MNAPAAKWAIAMGVLLSNHNKSSFFFLTFCQNLFKNNQNLINDEIEDNPIAKRALVTWLRP